MIPLFIFITSLLLYNMLLIKSPLTYIYACTTVIKTVIVKIYPSIYIYITYEKYVSLQITIVDLYYIDFLIKKNHPSILLIELLIYYISYQLTLKNKHLVHRKILISII